MGEEQSIREAASAALKLGRAGNIAAQRLTVNVETVDKFGNAGKEEALAFTWTAEDIQRVNWKGMSGYMALDLAHPIIMSREGLRSLGSWCNDADGRVLTPRLCAEPYESAASRFAGRLTR